MTVGIPVNTSPGFGRYIQADVYHRMNRELPNTETVTDNMVGCANESVPLAVKNFIKAPDKVGSVYGFIHTQSQAALPEALRNANTMVEYREVFKSVLGMLATKAENFTSTERGCYNKLCDRFISEVKKEPKEFNANLSMLNSAENSAKDDKQFWLEAAPLLETYSKDIMEDLIAHMLKQSINAWCEYHNVTDREWARSNIEQIFDSNIRTCFNEFDESIRIAIKESKSAVEDKATIHGSCVRFRYMKMFDAIASIPLTLRRQTPSDVAKPATTEKAVETSDFTDHVNGDRSPKVFSSPGNITVYGSSATATSASHGGNTPTTPPDPWSSMAEKLLASDKIDTAQRILLLKELIATLKEPREIPPNFFNHNQLISRLNSVNMQDTRLPNRNRDRLVATPPQETHNVEPTAPEDQVKRQLSTRSLIGSDISVMSPPRSPLGDNFRIGAQSPERDIKRLSSLETLSVVVDKGPAANDAEKTGRSEGTSSADSSSSAINKEDLALLKRWLGEEVQESDTERQNIDKLILREEGLYTQTMEHFLERAFLAEAGTEERSDKQQTYINESFRKMQSHDDFLLLSRNAQALVNKYSEKRNSRVLTTTPGVRRPLSSQISRGLWRGKRE